MPSTIVPYYAGLDYGIGVDTPSGEARNIAATGTPSTIPTADGQIVAFSMRQISRMEDLQTALGISASANGGVGLFSASARFDYAKNCCIHDSSVFLIVSIKVDLAFAQIKEPGIKPEAATLLANGRNDAFQAQYGDMFVRGLRTGGQFFGLIEIITHDQTDKETIAASVSASYATFSGSVQFNDTFKKAIQNRQVNIKCYIEGGQTSPLPIAFDTMTYAAINYPATVKEHPVPYYALLDSYSILPVPDPPTYIDLQHQKDVLIECAHLRDQDLVALNNIDYIMGHPSEFLDVTGYPLSQLRNNLSDDLNTIAASASHALNFAKDAKMPDNLKVGTITLPKRVVPSVPGREGNWHWCQKCQGLAFAGTSNGNCPAGGVHDLSKSGNYSLAKTADATGQHRWALCRKCQGLVYAALSAGKCPAGGGHDVSQSGDYALVLQPIVTGQSGWHWCNQCQSLAFAGGSCPAGGSHDFSQSSSYVLATGPNAGGQHGWRWCQKCQNLAFANISQGNCSAGGAHDFSKSQDYALPKDAGAIGQHGWRWCQKCQSLAFAGISQGNCPAGGVHDFSKSGDYTLTQEVAGQNHWRWCQKCQGLAFAGSSAPGVCPTGGAHDYSASGDYVLSMS